MKKTILSLLFVTLATACGPEPEPGVCFRYETRDNGERVEDTVLWKPCEAESGPGRCCAETFVERECVPLVEAQTEEECYRDD